MLRYVGSTYNRISVLQTYSDIFKKLVLEAKITCCG